MNELKNHKRHINFSLRQPLQESEFDILIVGTGAGGGIAAETLSKTGLKVGVIEEGPLKTQHDFKMNEAIDYHDLYQEAAARKTKKQLYFTRPILVLQR